MRKLNKLYPLFLTALLLSACQTDETVTEVSGTVIDVEKNTPVANVTLNLSVADGIDQEGDFVNPVNKTATSEADGKYTFILPENGQQQLYKVIPEKAGYVEVKDSNYFGKTLKNGEKNLHDVPVAPGSYLNLKLNQTPSETGKAIKLTISYTVKNNATPFSNAPILSERMSINPTTIETAISRGFFYKFTDKVFLTWEVTPTGIGGQTETFNQTVDLKEYDTIDVEIDY